MKELHHRVKNNLQLMSSINSIQLRDTSNAQVTQILKDNQARLDSLALMHNHFYQNDILDDVLLDEYLSGLLDALMALAGKTNVTLVRELDPIRVSPDLTIALGLIVNELFSNALKHAFPERTDGTIRFSMKAQPRHLVLSIEDDGIGLPTEQAANFGLKVVDILTRQLNGELTAQSTPGAHYQLTIPTPDTTNENTDR